MGGALHVKRVLRMALLASDSLSYLLLTVNEQGSRTKMLSLALPRMLGDQVGEQQFEVLLLLDGCQVGPPIVVESMEAFPDHWRKFPQQRHTVVYRLREPSTEYEYVGHRTSHFDFSARSMRKLRERPGRADLGALLRTAPSCGLSAWRTATTTTGSPPPNGTAYGQRHWAVTARVTPPATPTPAAR